MENIKTVDELRAAFPDLVAQVETAAQAVGNTAGVEAERARIQGIEAIENAIADKALINSAKYGEKPLTAEQLAFQAMQAQAAVGMKVLDNIAKDGAASGVEGVETAPTSGAEVVDEAVEAKNAVDMAVANFKKMKNGGAK